MSAGSRPNPRRAGLVLAGATLVFGIVWFTILVAGPDTVPGHFAADGTPTRWDSTPVFLGMMAALAGGLTLLFVAMPRLMARVPIEHVNLPNREQWNTPARRAHLALLMTEDLRLIGAVTMLLLAAMLVISALAGLGAEIAGWVFLATAAAYLVMIGIIVGRMLTGSRYTPPADFS